MKPTDALQIVEEQMPGVHRFLEENLSNDEKDRLEKVSRFIEGFESPFGLELLSTVYWAKKELLTSDVDEILQYVHNWSSRKKELMNHHEVNIALERVNRFS